jgi:hypothetical protein
MTPKERSDELNRMAREMNVSLEAAADEGLDVWVRTSTNRRIDAAPVAAISVSISKSESAG